MPRISAYPLPGREALRHNRVNWSLDPRRAALLVHDAQNYWMRRFEDPAPLVANLVRLRRSAQAAGMPTIFTKARAGDTREMRGLAYDMWGPGIGAYTEKSADDAEIIPELVPTDSDIHIEKAKYSAFFRTNLEERLLAIGIDQLIVCGVYCHHGCLLTAADAYMRNIKVFFAVDASADHNAAYHVMAVQIIADLCAQHILTDDLCLAMDDGPAGLFK